MHDTADEDALYERLITAGIRLVSLRPRSVTEIQSYFSKKLTKQSSEVRESVMQRLMDRMAEYGYADDEAFVKWWLAARSRGNAKGLRVIALELRRKGVDAGTIDRVLSAEGGTKEDEVARAKAALGRRWERWEKLPELERKKKLYGFLQYRGFSTDILRRLVDELAVKRYNERDKTGQE